MSDDVLRAVPRRLTQRIEDETGTYVDHVRRDYRWRGWLLGIVAIVATTGWTLSTLAIALNPALFTTIEHIFTVIHDADGTSSTYDEQHDQIPKPLFDRALAQELWDWVEACHAWYPDQYLQEQRWHKCSLMSSEPLMKAYQSWIIEDPQGPMKTLNDPGDQISLDDHGVIVEDDNAEVNYFKNIIKNGVVQKHFKSVEHLHFVLNKNMPEETRKKAHDPYGIVVLHSQADEKLLTAQGEPQQ